ncbi:CDK2-associated and cullin domain-containing protein 1 [Denticeps clupeoides]|uniref:Cullin N-terminal domain-containing protein n=1 Tax=Denticeps clupeoides TaxID=299321 RepID=A0AAY4C509_9TELE|nr:CDK2-associated and cullin domain-containing protein 1 [Denticeps clupeoides]
MEEMEEDRVDDHNHNYRDGGGGTACAFARTRLSNGAPLPVSPAGSCGPDPRSMDSDSSSVSSEASDAESPGASAAAAAGKLTLNSAAKFLMNSMTAEDYKKVYWPKLEKAVQHLLTQGPTDHVSISYEQIYSHVYKCVCQQHSELLYHDLIWKITCHLQQVSAHLLGSPPEAFIENFNLAFTQYTAALQCIVPVFIYMNKFYIERKLNQDLREILMKLFSDHVAERHVRTLLPLLKTAHCSPFQVKPSTMASVVKGLYSLRPDWATLAPAIFSRFIPQIHPPAVESRLPDYAAQDQKLQMELTRNGFPRGDQSRKRASEEC